MTSVLATGSFLATFSATESVLCLQAMFVYSCKLGLHSCAIKILNDLLCSHFNIIVLTNSQKEISVIFTPFSWLIKLHNIVIFYFLHDK